MYVVLVEFRIAPSFASEFHALVLQQAANSLNNEAACRRFDVSVDPDDAAHYLLYELYDDLPAFEAHQQTEYFAQFGAAIGDHVVEKNLTCWQMCDPA